MNRSNFTLFSPAACNEAAAINELAPIQAYFLWKRPIPKIFYNFSFYLAHASISLIINNL